MGILRNGFHLHAVAHCHFGSRRTGRLDRSVSLGHAGNPEAMHGRILHLCHWSLSGSQLSIFDLQGPFIPWEFKRSALELELPPCAPVLHERPRNNLCFCVLHAGDRDYLVTTRIVSTIMGILLAIIVAHLPPRASAATCACIDYSQVMQGCTREASHLVQTFLALCESTKEEQGACPADSAEGSSPLQR